MDRSDLLKLLDEHFQPHSLRATNAGGHNPVASFWHGRMVEVTQKVAKISFGVGRSMG